MDALTHLCRNRLTALVGPDFAKRRYLVAVSGGRDSMVLLQALCDLLPSDHLVVGHLDHGARPASGADSAFVARECFRRGLLCVSARIAPVATDEGTLREKRRAFLESVRRRHGLDFIVTAHHGRDQLETLLMRILRGTSLTGLAAIAPLRDGWLRPLLDVSPNALAEAARAREIAFREDETNTSPRYFRNRIRAEVALPLENLSATHGGDSAFYRRLSSMLDDLAAHNDLALALSSDLTRAIVRETPYWFRLERAAWMALAPRSRLAVLRHLLGGEVRDLSREWLRRVDTAVCEGRSAHFEGGVRLVVSCGHAYLTTVSQRKAPAPRFVREPRGVRCEELGLRLAIDPERLPPFECRTFRPGDRIGGRKLKEVFLTARIPAPERRLLPLITATGSTDVHWFPGRRHEAVAVTSLTFPFALESAPRG